MSNGLLGNFLAWLPFLVLAWGIIETIYLIQFKGRIRRGFMVWRKPLSKDIQNYLLSLSVNVLETEQVFSSERKVAFIRIENDEALIYGRRFGWRTFWPYVAYVDLTRSECFLEFRASLTMHLFLLTFLSSGVMTAFIIFMMGLNYYMETKAIEKFLERKTNEEISC